MHIADIPVEVLLDNLFPLAEVRDVLNLGSTSKLFATLCADEMFWKRRCQADFNFTSQETARQSGWKNLYRGLRHPRVFVWGQRANGRLGLKHPPQGLGHGVPYPIEVKIPGSRIVSLVAGGMSFHAIDSEGSLYVWGTLDGESPGLNSEGFAVKHKTASEPFKILMPNPIRTVSCGRLHTMALDSKNQIWTLLDTPMLDCTSPETTPIQAESGWSFSSILTQSGDVLVFWPSSGEIGRIFEEEDDHCIPPVAWSLQADPLRIPPRKHGGSQEERSKATTLIKIAAFDNHLIGLTNKGHVLKFGDLSNENSFNRTTPWKYLKSFSELSKVAAHPAFRDENAGLEAPKSLLITISIILMGDVRTDEDSQPKIIPELQNRSVISVPLGDYHYGALTADGQLLTWGQYSHGALGLGVPTELPLGAPGGYSSESQLSESRRSSWGPLIPPKVAAPSLVNFNHGKNPGGRRFCFAATAAGWHTGALVVCLEPEKEVYDDNVSTEDHEPSWPRFGQFGRGNGAPSGSQNQPSPSHAGALGFGSRIFRIGFAGGGWRGARGT
ncbi:regulator of chromosome condensation 1/beta-lactamase-inhibitor protein II [Russula vinacea]|nr:regulator of chromosome condensation 1/beta-lactamase-inhibitor protein II [Russula vinacea]